MSDMLAVLGAFFEATMPLWSAVVGAVSAVIAVRASARLQERRENRTRLASEIAGFLEACVAVVSAAESGKPARGLQARAAVASSRLVMGAGADMARVRAITIRTVDALTEPEGASAVSAAQHTLQDLYCGVKVRDVLDNFEQVLEWHERRRHGIRQSPRA